MSTISLCCNFKDEEKNAQAVYDCVKDVIDEFIVVDSGSTDKTVELCRDLGARIYPIEHPLFVGGYGGMRALTAHLSRCDWVVFLDGDERMLPADVQKLKALSESEYDFIWLPRQHYQAFDMSIVETRNGILKDATPEQQAKNVQEHPDFQPRFFRSHPNIRFERFVHERPIGFKNQLVNIGSPLIRHFGFLKTEARLQAIVEMCQELHYVDQEFQKTYEEENKSGYVAYGRKAVLLQKKWAEGGKPPKDEEWMKDYRRYWK